jgi:glycerol-3-phosphate cytidylyltransferase-like family protein
MNLKNRCIMLENIKCVDKVIPNCPFFGITEEFLNKYNITKVAYAGDDLGKWEEHYKVPIQKKIMINFKYDSSKTNISTSAIIKKIKNSY